jgi:hypothetical protein
MSVNAQNAYSDGKKPVSRITKNDILKYNVTESISFFRWFVKNKCDHCGWHHTSAKYNNTYFYDIENCCKEFQKADIEKLKAEYIEQEKSKPKINLDEKPYYAKIEYSISTFTGKRIKINTYAIVVNNWAYIKDDYKGIFSKKKITGKHFSISKKYETRPKDMPENVANTILDMLKKH